MHTCKPLEQDCPAEIEASGQVPRLYPKQIRFFSFIMAHFPASAAGMRTEPPSARGGPRRSAPAEGALGAAGEFACPPPEILAFNSDSRVLAVFFFFFLEGRPASRTPVMAST